MTIIYLSWNTSQGRGPIWYKWPNSIARLSESCAHNEMNRQLNYCGCYITLIWFYQACNYLVSYSTNKPISTKRFSIDCVNLCELQAVQIWLLKWSEIGNTTSLFYWQSFPKVVEKKFQLIPFLCACHRNIPCYETQEQLCCFKHPVFLISIQEALSCTSKDANLSF